VRDHALHKKCAAKARKREGRREEDEESAGVAILFDSFASCFALSRLRGACSGRRVIAQGYLITTRIEKKPGRGRFQVRIINLLRFSVTKTGIGAVFLIRSAFLPAGRQKPGRGRFQVRIVNLLRLSVKKTGMGTVFLHLVGVLPAGIWRFGM
jgi:hypothetical protein